MFWNRSESGLSLIEAMVALVILLIGILPVFKLYDVVGSQGSLQRQKAYALTIAADLLEQEKDAYLRSHWDGPKVTIKPTKSYNGITYTPTITYETKLQPDSSNQLLQLSAEVEWPAPFGTQQVTLTTYVTSR